METSTAIEQRRSIKKYDPNYVMPEADVRRLMELTLLSPTSFNIQNWRFVVVRDLEQKKRLRAAAWNQEQVETAQMVVLVCADLLAWKHEPYRYWKNAPQPTQEKLVPIITGFYEQAGPQMHRDEAMRSCGLAAQTLMLAAKSMGYDSCPMVGFDFEKVGQIINLPADHVISMMVVVGKAAASAFERGGQLPLEEVVFYDRFPT
jgi:nitroreductase